MSSAQPPAKRAKTLRTSTAEFRAAVDSAAAQAAQAAAEKKNPLKGVRKSHKEMLEARDRDLVSLPRNAPNPSAPRPSALRRAALDGAGARANRSGTARSCSGGAATAR